MDEQKKQSSTAQKTAEAASAINGAVKTGKAIAGSAKGAALGPYGLAASLAWTNRKLIGKIIAAAILILMIPILFILMLPSLIFGGLTEGFTSDDLNSPILNDNTAIIDNVNDISMSVEAILSEGIVDVNERIDSDFSRSGADIKEVNNPYNGILHNSSQFISAYCAYKNEDFESISISDMEDILSDAVEHLYSFTVKEEIVENSTTDETTGEVTITYETLRIYTITYNGENYFADNIFHLSDEQKSLSYEYAKNLSLFLGDGMFQTITGGTVISSLGDVIFTDGATDVVYFNQTDERWANIMYGRSSTIGEAGCGPTSMAIVISTLLGETHDPVELSEWSVANGYRAEGNGSYHALIPAAAEAYGLPVEGNLDAQGIVNALSDGKLVVVIMAQGHFTTGGHFIVLRGVTSDGKILVADPYSLAKSQQQWDLQIILNESNKAYAAGGPYWAIG